MDGDTADIAADLIFSITAAQALGNRHLNQILGNGRRLLTEFAAVFYPAGTAPDDRTVVLGDPAIGSAAFLANKKTTQYILGIVPGGLSCGAMFSCCGIGAPSLFTAHTIESVLGDGDIDIGCIG